MISALMEKLGHKLALMSFGKMRADIYEDMASSLRVGVKLDEVLLVYARRTKKKKYLSMLFSRWANRLGDVKNAGKFSKAMGSDIPESDRMIIAGFEEVGKTPDGLEEMSKIIRRSNEMRKALTAAVAGPMLSLTSILGASYFFGGDVMHMFERMAPVSKWPPIGQVTFYFCTFIHDYIYLVLPATIGGVFLFFWSLPNWAGLKRKKIDPLFPYSLYRDFQAGIFLIVLSSLLKAGLSLDNALRTLSVSSSKWMAWYLKQSIRKLGDREAISEDQSAAFDTGLFQDRIFWRLQDAGQRSGIAESINGIAENSFVMISDRVVVQAAVINKASIALSGMILTILTAGLVFTGLAIPEMIGAKF